MNLGAGVTDIKQEGSPVVSVLADDIARHLDLARPRVSSQLRSDSPIAAKYH